MNPLGFCRPTDAHQKFYGIFLFTKFVRQICLQHHGKIRDFIIAEWQMVETLFSTTWYIEKIVLIDHMEKS